MKDFQKARVYGGEQDLREVWTSAIKHDVATVEFAGARFSPPIERKFGDLASIQRYIDAVLDLNWVKATWPKASWPVSVRRRKGTRFAHYQNGVIAIPDQVGWAMRELVVLHELSHHLASGERHGPVFVGTFVALVTEILGPEAGFMLRVSMLDNGAKEQPVQVVTRSADTQAV